MKRIFAVDPGESGAIVYTDGQETLTQCLGDEAAVVDFIERNASNMVLGCRHSTVAYIEQVGGFIGDPEKSPGSRMFNFGDGYGFVRGALAMARIPSRLVIPAKWMRAVLPGVIGLDYSDRKRALKAYAQSLHPSMNVTLKTADALVLLEYAKRIESGAIRKAAGVPVVNSSGDYRADAKAAVKWARTAGYDVPKRGTKEYIAMVNYYCRTIKSPGSMGG